MHPLRCSAGDQSVRAQRPGLAVPNATGSCATFVRDTPERAGRGLVRATGYDSCGPTLPAACAAPEKLRSCHRAYRLAARGCIRTRHYRIPKAGMHRSTYRMNPLGLCPAQSAQTTLRDDMKLRIKRGEPNSRATAGRNTAARRPDRPPSRACRLPGIDSIARGLPARHEWAMLEASGAIAGTQPHCGP